MKPKRCFAAVRERNGTHDIALGTIRYLASEARDAFGSYGLDWTAAKAVGWRIRPVLVTVEEQGGWDGHE